MGASLPGIAAALLLLLLAAGLIYFLMIAPVGAAYKAKAVATGLFVAGRDIESLLAADVSQDSYRLMRLFRTEVDREAKTVGVSFLGFRKRIAAYREGLGATLTQGVPVSELKPAALPRPSAPPRDPGVPWPRGDGPAAEPPDGLDRGRLAAVVSDAFAEPNPARLRRTRAVLVVQDGRLIAERYAPGFGPDMPLPGWSMTKSVLGALIGIRIGQGGLALDRKNLLGEWSGPGDPRGEITLEDLLRMRSGLEFAEVYANPLSDVTQMLFARPDAARAAAEKPLIAPPGTRWSYSSGTSNILSRILKESLGPEPEAPFLFARRELFDPVGMRSAVLEPDAAGNIVGSSFLSMTARDWARFGLLYAQDGVRDGKRVLPEGWAAFGASPTPQSPGGCYGAHWWLKLHKELGGGTPEAARIPADAMFALGHEGQCLSVIPSLKLVTVRLGLSIYIDAWNHAVFTTRIADLVKQCLPDSLGRRHSDDHPWRIP